MLHCRSLTLQSLICHLRCGRAGKIQSRLSPFDGFRFGQDGFLSTTIGNEFALSRFSSLGSTSILQTSHLENHDLLNRSTRGPKPHELSLEKLSTLLDYGKTLSLTKAWSVLFFFCVREYMANLSSIVYISDPAKSAIWRKERAKLKIEKEKERRRQEREKIEQKGTNKKEKPVETEAERKTRKWEERKARDEGRKKKKK